MQENIHSTDESVLKEITLRPTFFQLSLSFVFIFFLPHFSATSQQSYSSVAVPSGMEYSASLGSNSSLVRDINGDGFVDIVYNSASGGAITYLQNNGSGSFSTPASNPFVNYTASSPAGFTANGNSSIADFDCDGDLDIWCRVSGTSNDVYLQNNAGTYSTGTVLSGMEFTPAGVQAGQVADINGDGFMDILYNSATGGAITYLQNNGSGSFSTPASNPFAAYTTATPTGFITNAIAISDFDGDGDLDIWGRVSGAANDAYLQNNSGTYSTASVLSGMEYSGSSILVGQVSDINGDGFIDILYNNTSGGAISYLQNNGLGSFSTPASNPFSAYTSSTPAGFITNLNLSIADFDCDGDLDLWCRVVNAGNDVYLQGAGEAPRLTSSTPANNGSNISTNANIVFSFSENVAAGAGNIYIRRLSDNTIAQTIAAASASVTGSGTSTITVNPPVNLAGNTNYFITFDRNALADVDEGFIFGSINTILRLRVPETGNNFLRFTTSGTLPVSLTEFSALIVNGMALLKWQTASEQNSSDFTVQHSTDGERWRTIGLLPAAGNSSTLQRYQFSDSHVAKGKNYYRLLQRDRDGRQTISPVRIIHISDLASFTLFPNPAVDEVTVQLKESSTATISMYNERAQEVYRRTVNSTRINISLKGLPAGMYHMLLQQGKTQFTHQLFHK